MSKKKTHEEYVYEVATKNPNIEVVGIYAGANIKIKHRCKIDGYEWNVTPHNILIGKGCPKCAGVIKRTHDQYLEEVAKVNPNIEVIGKYKKLSTPILHKCLIHDVIWNAFPSNILRGHGCVKCGGELLGNQKRKSHEQYVYDLNIVHPNIIVLEKYINTEVPILHKCIIDDFEWKAKPGNLLHGKGCPKCAGVMKKSHDEYVSELRLANPDIVALEEYVNAKTPILHMCLKDGYKWYTSPTNVLNKKNGCPMCNESSGERQIRQYLEKYDITYEYQKRYVDCRDINQLPFDFYLPDYNAIVEYDHMQHFEPIDYFGGIDSFEKTVKHDKIKNAYCKENGISLLRIPYYKNIEEALNNFLFI